MRYSPILRYLELRLCQDSLALVVKVDGLTGSERVREGGCDLTGLERVLDVDG